MNDLGVNKLIVDDLVQAIRSSYNDSVYKIVLSNPVSRTGTYRRMVVTRLPGGCHVEKFTATQVFSETLPPERVPAFLLSALTTDFRQYNAWDGSREFGIRISAGGRVLQSSSPVKQAPPVERQHDRVKNHILQEGAVIEPLVDMGIFTREGKVVRSLYDKFKQINRFLELVDDEIKKVDPAHTLTVIDFGCGKSYLTFVLYHYLTEIRKLNVDIVGLDLKADVIEKCNQTAVRYGYRNLRFEQGDIDGYRHDGPVDMVVTLHACDTATDFALYNAIRWNARMIFSVPCCQHELNAQIASERLSGLTRYGLVKERVAALMTDAIRGNLLECCGYKTDLLEFIELEHTPKNILIRATKRPPQAKQTKTKALAEVEALMDEFHLEPTLYRLLRQSGEI